MKLTNNQLEEAAFIFEKENRYPHSSYEKNVIKESNLLDIRPSELRLIIVNGLNSNLYIESADRVSTYWTLSKTNDKSLIPEFKNWLKQEVTHKNDTPIFQILTALDKFGEPAFNKNRDSRYYDEVELNFRDAKNYLENN